MVAEMSEPHPASSNSGKTRVSTLHTSTSQPGTFCHTVQAARQIRLAGVKPRYAHLSGISTEQAVPCTQINDVERVSPANFSRAKDVWRKSDWNNARGVLLFTSCMNFFISYTLNANLSVTSTSALSFNSTLRVSGCAASIVAMISTGVFGLDIVPFNLVRLDSFPVKKQVELLLLSRQASHSCSSYILLRDRTGSCRCDVCTNAFSASTTGSVESLLLLL